MEFVSKKRRIESLSNSNEENLSFDQDSSESSESYQESQSSEFSDFTQEQLNHIVKIFPEYERDIHFSGYERLIYFDSEFLHEDTNFPSLKSEILRVWFYWIDKNVHNGVVKIKYVLRDQQITYFKKILSSYILQNKKTYNFLEFFKDDYHMDLKFNYRIKCIETDSEFEFLENNGKLFDNQKKILTNEFIKKEHHRQKEIFEKDYSEILNDIQDVLFQMFIFNCKISIDDNIYIYCDVLSVSDENIFISIDGNLINNFEDMYLTIYIIKKQINDPNYGQVTIQYFYEQNYLRQFLPYFAEYNDKEYVFFNRDYLVLGAQTETRELAGFRHNSYNTLRFFNDESSPLKGGDISKIRVIAEKITSSGLDKLLCLNPNINTEKLFRLSYTE